MSQNQSVRLGRWLMPVSERRKVRKKKHDHISNKAEVTIKGTRVGLSTKEDITTSNAAEGK